MHRWHELVAEGDYGRPSQTSGGLVRLAEAGPDVGIHVVAWADSYTTAERALRRAGLAHFGLRAAARMLSPAESDALLGVSAAAGLDDNRALYRDTFPCARRSGLPSSPTSYWPGTPSGRESWPPNAKSCSCAPGNC